MQLARRTVIAAVAAFAALALQASWYWPFGGGDGKESVKLSDLVEQASLEIDDAVDAAAEGKLDEALEHYRKALDELDRVERENPAITPLPEYASLRNKRAYVNAAMDSLRQMLPVSPTLVVTKLSSFASDSATLYAMPTGRPSMTLLSPLFSVIASETPFVNFTPL